MIPDKDELNHTKKSIKAMIDVAMGGRAAEDIFMGDDEISSGKGWLRSIAKGAATT